MARPTKLTAILQKDIVDLLLAGNFVETVCDYVGISRETFYDWLKRGERGHKKDIDGGYVEFSDTIKKAIAQVEILTIADLRVGPQNWQAKAWWLERRHPDKWGNRQKHEQSGEVILRVVYGDDKPDRDSDPPTEAA